MSHHVYIDRRTNQIMSANLAVQNAVNMLGAESCQISCGRAEISTTDSDVDAQAKLVQAQRMQDTVVLGDNAKLKADASRGVDNLAATELGDWKPAISKPEERLHVDNGEVEGDNTRRLVEDLQVAAFDGARMMVFEVTGPDGQTSYELGLDEMLFDADGNWVNNDHKDAYDAFLRQTMAAQRVALAEQEEQNPVTEQTNAALRLAGLREKKSKKVGGGVTHRIVTNEEAADAKPKTLSVGGKRE